MPKNEYSAIQFESFKSSKDFNLPYNLPLFITSGTVNFKIAFVISSQMKYADNFSTEVVECLVDDKKCIFFAQDLKEYSK